MPITLLAIANFLHLIATITWVGGMIIMRLIVTPALRTLTRQGGLSEAEQRAVLRAIGQRGASYTSGAIVVFIITGLAMLSLNPNYTGFLVFGNLWTQIILLKHVAVAGLIISTAYINTTVNRRLASADNEQEYARWQERRRDLADVNFLLGLVILGLTAIATSIPAGG
jgi:uncharacterized membrane protein